MSDYQHIRVETIAPALGAVIHEVDCRANLSDRIIEEIRKDWLQHLVVVLPDQNLGPAGQLAFARRVGAPGGYPMDQGMMWVPEVVQRALIHI